MGAIRHNDPIKSTKSDPRKESTMPLSRLLALLCLLIVPLTTFLPGFSDGPLPQLTGGFQEETCHSCHNSFPLNEGRTRGGIFLLSGVPTHYQSGESYPITVVIGQPGQRRWGFELSVRSAASGEQAGRLETVDDRTQLKEAEGIQYIQQNSSGTQEGILNGPVEFHFNWIAPDLSAGLVFFNAAGNAADGSGDSAGDYIYTAGAFSSAFGSSEAPLSQAQPESQPRLRMNTTSRFMHLPAPVDLKKGDTETHIEHRFLEPIVDAGFGRAFGIDSGANINLGLNYALTDELTAGVSRTRFGQIVVLTGTYEIHTDPESPWNMSFLGGVEGEDNFHNHYSTVLQLPTFFDYKRLRTHVVPTMIFNSRKDEDLANPINPESNHTFSLGLGADLALHPRVSLTGEYVPRLAGFGGFGDEPSTLSWGVKLRTRGHVFTILLTNTRDFTPARYGVNSGPIPGFALGFDLYRKSWQ